uniref:Uncharacterized protein n=1 Tax=Arundo donax TaxID=35708 RepID=A0A0A9B613_ARUDO
MPFCFCILLTLSRGRYSHTNIIASSLLNPSFNLYGT